MEKEGDKIVFKNVREFREFQNDLLKFLNLSKILEIIGEEKIIMRLKTTRIVFLRIVGTNSVATGSEEEWLLLGSRNGEISEIKTELIEPTFFILTDNWKLLKQKQLEKLFEISDEYKKNKKIREFVNKEYQKALDCLQNKNCQEKLDHNLALFIKKWAIPITPPIAIIKNNNEKLRYALKKFATIYENSPPIDGLEEINQKVESWKMDPLYPIYNKQ